MHEVPQHLASSNHGENQPACQRVNSARAWCGRRAPHQSESPFTTQFSCSSTRLCTSQAHQIRSLSSSLSAFTLSSSLFNHYCFDLSLSILVITILKNWDKSHKSTPRNQHNNPSKCPHSCPAKLVDFNSWKIIVGSGTVEIALTNGTDHSPKPRWNQDLSNCCNNLPLLRKQKAGRLKNGNTLGAG